MWKKTSIVFACIFILAAFLRLYALVMVPPSPSLDEVSIGYNAYSILTTGRDEYGYRLPLLLRAYDDWRPALYVYLVIPFVKAIGLSPLAVRFPSILLSLCTVWLLYKMGKVIAKTDARLTYLGEVSSFILAISPWHIYISRLGHEANLGLTLTTAGIYAFLVFIVEKKSWSFIFAGIWFALSLHGYQSQKLIVPILGIVIFTLYWRVLFKQWKNVVIAVCFFSVIAIPAVYVTVTGEGLSRLKGTSAFAADAPVFQEAFIREQKALKNGDYVAQIIHTRKVVMARVFSQNYLSHFSPMWLFTGRVREAHKVPYMGLLYPWESIGLIIGLIYVCTLSTIPIRIVLFLGAWLLTGPLPASITTQAPHAMRAYTLLPALSLLGAIGWIEIWHVTKRYFISSRWILVACVLVGSLMYFWKGYFITFPNTQSDAFQFAMKDAVTYVHKNSPEYKRVVFSNNDNLYQSYMFYLYYSVLNPSLYLSLGGTVSAGYDKPHTIGNVEFRSVNWSREVLRSDTLYVGDVSDLPSNKRVLTVSRNLDGADAIVIFTL